MTLALKAFVAKWNELVREDTVAPLTGTELQILRIFDDYLLQHLELARNENQGSESVSRGATSLDGRGSRGAAT